MNPDGSTIRVKVLFFGRLKELTGLSEDQAELTAPATLEQLFALYSGRHTGLAPYRCSVVASLNQELAPWDSTVQAGDEIAFLPPVSGG